MEKKSKIKLLKTAIVLLILTVIATITLIILNLCKIVNVKYQVYTMFGLLIYWESIAIYSVKKSLKNN